jgi:hypothetical protein
VLCCVTVALLVSSQNRSTWVVPDRLLYGVVVFLWCFLYARRPINIYTAFLVV